MSMNRRVYRTNLSTIECLQRLRSHVAPSTGPLRRPSASPGEGTIIAKVNGERFRIFARGPRYVHNSFAPFLYGRVAANADGTRIDAKFRMHPVVRVFMSVWFGGLAIMALAFPLILLTGNLKADVPPFTVIATPFLIILFGIGLIAFGRWTARGQVSRILEFLRVELEATPEV